MRFWMPGGSAQKTCLRSPAELVSPALSSTGFWTDKKGKKHEKSIKWCRIAGRVAIKRGTRCPKSSQKKVRKQQY
jgi:hypothetical protein